MAGELKIELCPETGICSIVRPDSTKVDLMPDEVAAIRESSEGIEGIRRVIGDCDDGFASRLGAAELAQIGRELK